VEITNFLSKYYKSTKIPMQVYRKGKLVKDFNAGRFTPNLSSVIISLLPNNSDASFYTVSQQYVLSGCIRILKTSELLIIGPALTTKCTLSRAQSILSDFGLPLNRADEFLNWISAMPVYTIQQFMDIINLLNYFLNDEEEAEATFIPYNPEESQLPQDAEPAFIEHLGGPPNDPVFSYVENGNVDAIKDFFKEVSTRTGDVPLIAADAIRSFKNIFIHALALVSFHAIKGGLDFDTATTLDDMYIKQIEEYDSFSGIFEFQQRMFLDFTRRTAQCRLISTDSLLVNRICKIVHSHLYEKITPTDISVALGKNCSHICRHFKHKTKMSITEYINMVKIAECKHLLESSDLSLIQISLRLGFSSQSYMHTVFKRFTGFTPTEYKTKYSK